MNRGTALIVGAGIGGLASGIALTRAGCEVEIFERAATPRELGFALALAPNAMRALGELGLAGRVTAGGSRVTRGEMRTASGERLRQLDFSSVHERLGVPSVCVLRPVLHGALLEQAERSCKLSLGSQVIGFEATPDGVDVLLEGGAKRRGQILIGADGVYSAIRKTLHPDEPAVRPSGLLGIRGVASADGAPLDGVDFAIHFGRGLEAGITRTDADHVYWYLSVVADEGHPVETRGHDDELERDPRALAAGALAQLEPAFRTIVERTEITNLRVDRLVDRAPLQEWGRGPVTLLGDAAHPMLPHAGQGAAQALQDAVTLAEALTDSASIEQGLRAYERVRIPRSRAVVELSRRNSRVGALTNSLACAARNLAIRLMPESMILKSEIDVGSA